MANHRADGRAQVRKLRATGGTHRDGALPASAVKVGVLGALATATIAAPLAAAAAGVDESAEFPQAAGNAAPAAQLPVEPVALPVADLAGSSADGSQIEAREAASSASRDEQRAAPAVSSDDAEADAAEEEPEGTGIEVEAPEPEPEPEPEEAVAAESGDAPAAGDGGYVNPVDAPITSGYGYRTHPVLGYGKLHEGVDFGAACGTPVHSAQSGTVIAVEHTSASGNRVKVDHGNGVVTGYYHLQGFATSEGASVEAGEVIGYVGNTGRSTGCHLHYAKMDEAGNYSNPMSILR